MNLVPVNPPMAEGERVICSGCFKLKHDVRADKDKSFTYWCNECKPLQPECSICRRRHGREVEHACE